MRNVRLYGPNWSAYVRTARLALIEKGVEYDLVEVDFSNGKMPAAQLARQPFGKVPALDHDDFQLYETTAICRYVDAAFPGPNLQPSEPRLLARMAQIIALLDAYVSAEVRLGIVNEGLIKPLMNLETDQDRLEQSVHSVKSGLRALSECTVEGELLIGNSLTLADLHAAPLFAYLIQTPGGTELIATQPTLESWWSNMSTRPSILNTVPDLSAFTKRNLE